jgi:hypothetical protein
MVMQAGSVGMIMLGIAGPVLIGEVGAEEQALRMMKSKK